MVSIESRQTTWRSWFKELDVNRDGVLTAADWREAGQKFVKAAQLSSEAAAVAMGIYAEWGELIFGLGGRKGGMSLNEDIFIQNITNLYTRNPHKCKQLLQNIFTKLLECSDTNKDGCVSEKEYILRNYAFGLTQDQSRQIYQHMGTPGPRGIPIETAAVYFGSLAIGEKDFSNITTLLAKPALC